MKNNTVIELVGTVVVAVIMVNATITLINLTGKGINKMMYNHKIKKGLKDGSIVEINGAYYEVEVNDIIEEA